MSFFEADKVFLYHQAKGFPELDKDTQCEILISRDYSTIMNLFPEITDKPFPLGIIAYYITITQSEFYEYFIQSDFVRKNLRLYESNPHSDGMSIRKIPGNNYEIIYQERGHLDRSEIIQNRDLPERRLAEIFYNTYSK